MGFLTHRVLWAHRQRVTTGGEGLVGEIGEALSDLNPEGRIFVHGESWSARSRVSAVSSASSKIGQATT